MNGPEPPDRFGGVYRDAIRPRKHRRAPKWAEGACKCGDFYWVALQLMDSYLRVVKLISNPIISAAIENQSG